MCLRNDQSWTKHPSLCCCRCYYCYLSRRYWWTFYHERIYKETRVCPILGVSSTRWIARHISADIFFRQRKEISDDLAEAHPLLLSLSLPLHYGLFLSLFLSFPASLSDSFPFQLPPSRWRVAVDSRFKWVWRIAIARITLCFRDVRLRFPMNNASSWGNRYVDCWSVPTYTLLSLPSP